MRLLPLTLLLFAVACGGSSSREEYDNNSHTSTTRYGWDGELYGDIETIVEQGYDVKNRLHGEELIPSYCQTIKFNALGDVDEIFLDNDSDNIIDSNIKYYYDEQNHLTHYVNHYKDGDRVYTTQCETDARGNITLYAHYDNHSISQYGSKYLYNSNDKPIEISHYDKSGELSSKELITYHNNGELYRCVEYNAEGELKSEFITTLNNRGKIVKIRLLKYDDKGDISSIQEQDLEYNKQKQLIRVLHIDKLERVKTERTMEYDAKGNVVKINRYESEACILKEVTERNITYRK
jgi:hypothetical protein